MIVIGALNYDLNAYQKGFRRLLKWDVMFLIILNTLMFVLLSLIVGFFVYRHLVMLVRKIG